jgi:hypothetical protein
VTVNGSQPGQGTQAAPPGCSHKQHTYRIFAEALAPAAYEGLDRGQALSALVAIRQAAREGPALHRIGFAVADFAGPEPSRWCVSEEDALSEEAERLAPVPPGRYEGVSFLGEDTDIT